jgi:hypothetical protein
LASPPFRPLLGSWLYLAALALGGEGRLKSRGFEKTKNLRLRVRLEPEHFKLLRDLSDLDLPSKKLGLDLARPDMIKIET